MVYNKRLYRVMAFTLLLVFLAGSPVSAPAAPSAGPDAPAAFVVAAVGDGAGGSDTADHVSDLLVAWQPEVFIYLGDVYENGSADEFRRNYGTDTFFGRLK